MGTHPIFESDFDCLTDNMILNHESVKSFAMAKTFQEHQTKVNSICFSFDGERCLAASDDDSISIYLMRDGTLKKKVFSKKYGVTNVQFTHSSNRCVYGSNKINHDIRLHDLEEEKYIRYFNGHQHTVVSLSMNPTDYDHGRLREHQNGRRVQWRADEPDKTGWIDKEIDTSVLHAGRVNGNWRR